VTLAGRETFSKGHSPVVKFFRRLRAKQRYRFTGLVFSSSPVRLIAFLIYLSVNLYVFPDLFSFNIFTGHQYTSLAAYDSWLLFAVWFSICLACQSVFQYLNGQCFCFAVQII